MLRGSGAVIRWGHTLVPSPVPGLTTMQGDYYPTTINRLPQKPTAYFLFIHYLYNSLDTSMRVSLQYS